jgi:hypothetical protein
MDESLSLQLRLLRSCMRDDCPLVRELAGRGVSKLLATYWELLPLAAISVFVAALTSALVHAEAGCVPSCVMHHEQRQLPQR